MQDSTFFLCWSLCKDVKYYKKLLYTRYDNVIFQVAFHEIFAGMWVRNGLQIKGQAMTYIQCHFCNSMVDADLYLLQVSY